MKKFHTGKRILTLFMPGFLFGIIYTNFIARQYVAEPEVFSDYFLQQFLQTRIVAQEFIWYVLKVRAIPFAVLLGLAFTKMRKMTASLFAIWTGISGGILLSIAGTGNQRKYLLPAGDFSSVPLLYSFFSDCSFLLLDVSEKQMEQRKNHYVCRYAFKWDDHGNLCKSVFAACFSEKILILTTNWLIRSPQRYPCMPDSGITI